MVCVAAHTTNSEPDEHRDTRCFYDPDMKCQWFVFLSPEKPRPNAVCRGQQAGADRYKSFSKHLQNVLEWRRTVQYRTNKHNDSSKSRINTVSSLTFHVLKMNFVSL